MASRAHPALDLRFRPEPDTADLHDLLHAELDGFEPLAIQEHETADGWRVFFRHPTQRDAARAELDTALGHRLAGLDAIEVQDEDWARRSQAALTAVRAGRLVISPPWDPAATGGGHPAEIVVVIDPSMGFGTGHHATTRLCLELLQDVDLAGRSVIDVGTGSGVLAIAAARLGATPVIAIDNDPDALQNARANATANRVSLDLREADLARLDLPPAEVVLANLTGVVLQRHAAGLCALAAPGATLIVSGFGPSELSTVSQALAATVLRELREGDWCAARVVLAR